MSSVIPVDFKQRRRLDPQPDVSRWVWVWAWTPAYGGLLGTARAVGAPSAATPARAQLRVL
jgi:hypothetical protein